ncbi:Dihydroorotate dehydrogenase (quinone), mitochondrial [Pseudocercospora fuligena]|uniref:Dihydroorotate dehydrogenase (quinone), mitochondrial n=1 Tax=Pseudocercospora fuligena TaxID=685502 RepID=A0A8H6VIJ6_9PEZI|nr:Dihydroorotate dehydrogenase (quinone), mitochondrial [Pseudocercospora fuligena]
MLATQRLFGASAQLLRQSSGLNRAQWRSVQRQWQRQLSSDSLRPRQPPRIAQHLRSQRRYQSTTEQAKTAATKAAVGTANTGSRLIAYVYGTGLVLLLSLGYLYITDTRASLHQYFVVPLIRLVYSDAEDAHHAGVRYIKGLYDFNLHIRERGNQDKELGDLKVEVFGHILDNPVGTSAGIDKDAEIPDVLMALGPAVVEVGGATPLPQLGNPKPRVFRIPSQNALINRYGLNSEGAAHVATQLRERVRQFAYANGLGLGPDSEKLVLDGEAGVPPGSLTPGKILAVQIAKNKTTPDADIAAVARDYVFCVDHLAKYADVLVVNVSSPNTPGLRDLQATAPLTAILSAVVVAAKSVDRKTKPAVMVKVSPDEDTDSQIEGICSAVWASGVDGVIVGNTTKKRPDPLPRGYVMPAKEAATLTEVGGYSGPQMFKRTLDLVKRYRIKLDQGPQDDAQDSSQMQKQVQSVLEPVEDKDKSVEETVKRDQQRLKPMTSEAEQESKQPLVQIPDRHLPEPTQPTKNVGKVSESHPVAAGSSPNIPPTTEGKASSPREAAEGAVKKVIDSAEKPKEAVKKAVSKVTPQEPTPSLSPASKVIFATGGITNGEQCLEILNAGASVCQIYTAMMYGGVGTVTRIKSEMREAIKGGKDKSS